MTIKHTLDILCEGYTGNFEIELVSYVFNTVDYDQDHRDLSDELTDEEKAETSQVLGEGFLEPFYGEYGLSSVELGDGPHPITGVECDSVRVYVSDGMWKARMDERAIELIKARANAFFALGIPDATDGAFVGLRHTTVVTTETAEFL